MNMRKTTVDNPRYPHYIRIIRKVVKDWLDDDEPAGNAAGTDDSEEFVVYAGPGRSYTDTTTTGDAKVDTNKRKASIPVRFDAWGGWAGTRCQHRETLVPMSGDILYVQKGHIAEEWEVKDFEPDNDRSVVYGELNRNYNV
jgi:hypothetical protein